MFELERRMRVTLVILLIFIVGMLMPNSAICQETIKFETDPPQAIDIPYRIFRTYNMWNMLLLDTRDGRLWQIQFSVDSKGARTKHPINNTPLVDESQKQVGRFTLYPTENIWTFLLLDQYTGDIWQSQFSIDSGKRFIIPILEPLNEGLKEYIKDQLQRLPTMEQEELLDSTTPEARKKQIIDALLKEGDDKKETSNKDLHRKR